MIRVLDRITAVAILFCPLFLLHGRGIAEGLIDVVAVCLLLRSSLARDWQWLRFPWVPVAAIWWGWLVVCSVPAGPLGAGGRPALVQALLGARFLLFVAALQSAAPRMPGLVRLMRWLVACACGYILLQLLVQYVWGHNLFGVGRFGDGTLTGPYDKPRAAAPLSRLLLPTMLLCSTWAAGRARAGVAVASRFGWRLLSLLPLLGGLTAMVLAGQRMPLLLTLLGLLVAGLLLPRLRPVVAAALAAAPVLVAASALLSPRSFGHLVVKFTQQMAHFGHSAYGLIYTRAVAIAVRNPLTGLGFDGFRHGCAQPIYFRGWPPWGADGGDGGGAGICVQHAHNHYLQALTDAGLPGLLLFSVLIGSWLVLLGRGLSREPDPLSKAWRTGLFAAVFIHEWPIASASAFTNMPLGGWFFLLLGLGLAEAAPISAAAIPKHSHSERDHVRHRNRR